MTIWKFTIPAHSRSQVFTMREGADVVSAVPSESGKDIHIYALVNTYEEECTVWVELTRTGEEVPEGLRFVQSVSMPNGDVQHVWQQRAEA